MGIFEGRKKIFFDMPKFCEKASISQLEKSPVAPAPTALYNNPAKIVDSMTDIAMASTDAAQAND